MFGERGVILSLNHSCKDRQYLIGFEWTIYFLVIVVFFKSRCLFEAQSIHMRDVLLMHLYECGAGCLAIDSHGWSRFFSFTFFQSI